MYNQVVKSNWDPLSLCVQPADYLPNQRKSHDSSAKWDEWASSALQREFRPNITLFSKSSAAADFPIFYSFQLSNSSSYFTHIHFRFFFVVFLRMWVIQGRIFKDLFYSLWIIWWVGYSSGHMVAIKSHQNYYFYLFIFINTSGQVFS